MNKKQPYISIVMVCYNYAHLLPRALEAIKRQKFRDFELVFVDNGCTDNSLDVINKFRIDNPEIEVKIVSIEVNKGVAHGDNTGAKAANGKYILFHDADDWMDDDTLEKLAEAAKKSDADRVIGTYRSISDEGKIVHVQVIADKPIQQRYTMQQANLFKNSLYKEHNIEIKGSLWNDAEKTLRFARYAQKVEYVYEPCYNYLVHLDSTSKNKKIHEKMWTKEYSIETLLKNVSDEYVGASENELMQLEYGCIYIYYSYLLQFLRNASLKQKFEYSQKLEKIMIKFFPNYKKNILIKQWWKGGKSVKSRILVYVLCMAEKCKAMNFVLLLYHILSKVHYFQAN